MKYLLKYIFLLVILAGVISPVYARKNKKARTTQVKNRNLSKKSKKATTQKKKKNNSKKQKTDKVNLNTLLNETIVTVAPTKFDSLPEKVVTIYSAFKPQLKNVAKIGFNNASAFIDTSSLALNYQVPSQNLSFQYRPIALVPRAMIKEKDIELSNIANVKIGMGNYQQHFAQLNFNAVDNYQNTHAFNISNQASTGTEHHLQMLRKWGGLYLGSLKIDGNNKIKSSIFFQQSQRYRYGLVPDSSNLPASNYLQELQHFGIHLAWLRLNDFKSKFQLKPVFSFEYAKSNHLNSGNGLVFKSPVYYQLKNNIKINFDFNASISNHQTNNLSQNNYYLKLDPSISMEKWGSQLLVGVSPVWSNTNKYTLYPNLNFQKQLKDTNYLIKTGWKTIITNNHFATLANNNPWLGIVDGIKPTILEQKFIHLEISSNKKTNYSAGISLNDYRNLVLYNTIIDQQVAQKGLQYQVIFEPRAITIQLDASMQYQFSDKLYILNKLSYVQFNSLKENAKPWGILPFEISSKANWLINNKWSLEGSLQYWTGASQTNQLNQPINTKNALSINAGFNYQLAKKWSLWAKGDNLLNTPYERWGYYPSLGVQIIAGINYTFLK